jgi:hypothetical protein
MFAAGPERADEGGGPTPGDIEGSNTLRDHSEVESKMKRAGAISVLGRVDAPVATPRREG